MTEVSPNVLRNRGVPVKVAVVTVVQRVVADGTVQNVPERSIVMVDGEEHTQEVDAWIRFTNNTFADMEAKWGSLSGYAAAATEKPKSCLRELLALVWGLDERVVGEMMLYGLDEDYTAAIGAAMAVANGVDPMKAMRLLGTSGVASAELRKLQNAAVDELLDEADEALSKTVSPSSNGSAPGSKSAKTPPRSGSRAPRRSL